MPYLVITHVAFGLGIAFVQWAYAFVLGFFALEVFGKNSARRTSYDAVDLLILTATGFAIEILVLFCLAQFHVFYAAVILAGLIGTLLAAVLLSLRKLPAKASGLLLYSSLRNALNPAWLIVFACCAFLSAPAALPPVKYDSIMYHLAYAVEWSRHGGLTVDPFLHFPLAEFNFELLYAMMFAFKLGDYVQFETWTLFCVTATGSVAFTMFLLSKFGARPLLASAGGIVVSIVYISCPMVISLMDTAYIDLPAGALMLAVTAAALRARIDFSRFGFAISIIGGCFIGAKISFLPSLALFIALIVLAARKNEVSRKAICAAILLLIVFASPWYLRNLAVAGDPVDPVLNLALHHTDPYWNAIDLQGQKNDLNRPIPFFAIPAWQYFNPLESEGAVSSSFLFFYVAILLALILCAYRRLRESHPELTLMCGIVIFAMLQQFAESSRFNRYSMPFFAVFIILIAITSWLGFRWLSKALFSRMIWQFDAVAIALLFLMTLPPPAPFNEYHDLDYEYQILGTGLRYPQFYLGGVAGYQTASNLAKLVAVSGTGQRVLSVNFQNLHYFFRSEGVIAVGDWWGPGRYSGLMGAIADDTVGSYLRQLSIGAIMYGRDIPILGDSLPKFVSEIEKAGFVEISDAESDSRAFVRPELLSAAEAHGFKLDAAEEPSNRLYLEGVFQNAAVYNAKGELKEKAIGNAGFIFSVLDDRKRVNAVTITAGNEIRFPILLESNNSHLSFDVSKVFSAGSPAVGWIDLQERSKRTRIFSETLPVAVGNEPIWKTTSLPVRSKSRAIELIFGAGSIPGGGNADWVAFAHPILTNARIDKSITDVARPVTAVRSTATPDLGSSVALPAGQYVRLVSKAGESAVSFTANPNPAPLNSGASAATITVNWNVPNATQVEVHMATPNGQLFASGPSSGSATTGPWVSRGATFYLQDVSHGTPGTTVAELVAQ